MFGTFRLILAVLVSSHHWFDQIKLPDFFIQQWSYSYFGQGVFAVIGFYILSGFLMSYVYQKRYKIQSQPDWLFWLDRTLRIFPQYFFYLAISAISYRYIFNQQFQFTVLSSLAHITLIPLNYFQILPISVVAGSRFPLIPVTWSLGLIFQFYLLIPFLTRQPRLLDKLSLASVLFFGFDSLWGNNPSLLSYYLIPGVFFVFSLGIYLRRYLDHQENHAKRLVQLIYSICIIIASLLFVQHKLDKGVVIEILLGVFIWVPVILWLSRYSYQKSIDMFLGNLAYGVFLNHFITERVLRYFLDLQGLNYWLVVIFSCLVFSFLSYRLDVWVRSFRVRLYRH